MKRSKILSIGGFSGYGVSNTCLLRNNILRDIGDVTEIDTTSKPINFYYRVCNKLFQLGLPVYLPDLNASNDSIRSAVSSGIKYDIVWIDKGIIINKTTFECIKQKQQKAKIIGYSPDWMAARHNQSQQFLDTIKFYDCFATTKSYSIQALKELGAQDVYFIDNAFQKGFHRPYLLSEEEKKQYNSVVSFIGSWEKDRSDSLEFLAANGISINIWGSGKWKEICDKHELLNYMGGDLQDERYSKVISASKISLCFLRKMNLDLQTTRSIEIPACGAMMLAERTEEHKNLFKEGIEADYFSSDEELLEKCQYYISNEDVRRQLASAGLRRCIESDYSYGGRIKQIIDYVLSK